MRGNGRIVRQPVEQAEGKRKKKTNKKPQRCWSSTSSILGDPGCDWTIYSMDTWDLSQWVENIGCLEGGYMCWRQGGRGSRVPNLKQNGFSEVGDRITQQQTDG